MVWGLIPLAKFYLYFINVPLWSVLFPGSCLSTVSKIWAFGLCPTITCTPFLYWAWLSWIWDLKLFSISLLWAFTRSSHNPLPWRIYCFLHSQLLSRATCPRSWWYLSPVQPVCMHSAQHPCRMCCAPGAQVTPASRTALPTRVEAKSMSDSSAALQFIAHGLLFPTFSRFPKAAGVYSLKITFTQHKEISLAWLASSSRGWECVHSVLPDYG